MLPVFWFFALEELCASVGEIAHKRLHDDDDDDDDDDEVYASKGEEALHLTRRTCINIIA